ncbi:MAG: hypothetical protein HYV97_06765 [Bdellovibrio sp.]|nr:hypothetical protein [Bdellovibrio sp.]
MRIVMLVLFLSLCLILFGYGCGKESLNKTSTSSGLLSISSTGNTCSTDPRCVAACEDFERQCLRNLAPDFNPSAQQKSQCAKVKAQCLTMDPKTVLGPLYQAPTPMPTQNPSPR